MHRSAKLLEKDSLSYLPKPVLIGQWKPFQANESRHKRAGSGSRVPIIEFELTCCHLRMFSWFVSFLFVNAVSAAQIH